MYIHTASLVAWTTYYLCRHPEVEQKLAEEIAAVLSDPKFSGGGDASGGGGGGAGADGDALAALNVTVVAVALDATGTVDLECCCNTL